METKEEKKGKEIKERISLERNKYMLDIENHSTSLPCGGNTVVCRSKQYLVILMMGSTRFM